MESCKFHSQNEAVTRCKICGAPLCEECEKVYQKYHACPKCANKQLQFELSNYKRGLKYIYLALACLVADFALFVTELIISKSITNVYLIVSIIFFVLFTPFCIWLVINRTIKIKKRRQKASLQKLRGQKRKPKARRQKRKIRQRKHPPPKRKTKLIAVVKAALPLAKMGQIPVIWEKMMITHQLPAPVMQLMARINKCIRARMEQVRQARALKVRAVFIPVILRYLCSGLC